MSFFSGGASHEAFKSLFDPALEQKLAEKMGEEEVIIYGEAYGGCLCWRTPVTLCDGSKMEIGDIVNNKLEIEVLSYNFETHNLEPKPITNWYRTKNENNWKTIFFKRRFRGGKSTKIVITDDHIVYVNRNGEIKGVRCKDLKIGDEVFMPYEKLSHIQQEIIRGCLLGDGHLGGEGNHYFSFAHSEKQSEYLLFLKQMLRSLNIKEENYISGFGSSCKKCRTKSLPEFSDIYKELYVNNKKRITLSYLNKLSPLSLAVWYMDDGSLSKNNIGSHRNVSVLHTQGFTENDVDLIVDWFNSKDLKCRKENCANKYFIVKFTPDGTEKFQHLISPYIISEMKYKINDEFHFVPFVLNITKDSNLGLIKTKVDKIEDGNPYDQPCYNERFDIEVKDNHNFFANNILVHNSMQGMSKTYGTQLKFVVFDVKIHGLWLTVPHAEAFSTGLGLEFVHYVKVPTTLEALNAERDADSVQAIRNGVGPGKMREGVVLRPRIEIRKNNDERIICKHKRDEFRETQETRFVADPEKLKVLEDATAVANEWVTAMRLEHVLDKIPQPWDITQTKMVISAMLEDVLREGKGEFVDSPEVRKAIGKKAADLFKAYFKEKLSQIAS